MRKKIIIFLILFSAQVFSLYAENWQHLISQAEKHMQMKEYKKGIKKAYQALNVADNQFGKKSKQVKDSVYLIALIYFYAGETKKAEAAYKQFASL